MTDKNQSKKALWIFPNFKESIDELPKSQRALVWQAVCEIGLGYDFDIKKCTTSQKMCIKLIYPLLKLRNVGGSIVSGEKRNPEGKNGLNDCNKTIHEDNPYPNPLDNPMDNPEDNSLYKKEIRNKEQEKEKEKKKKLSFDDVSDWNDLMTYWEENKKGGKYKSDDSRERMLERLKCLTGNDFDFAKQAICHCIDNGYQGFCNGNELYYKLRKPRWKTIDTKPDAYEEFSLAVEEMKRRVAQ